MKEEKTDYMSKIKSILGESAKDNDIKRENANIDGDSAMGTMLQLGSTTSREYSLTYLLGKDVAEAHLKGDIHIHDLDFYAAGCTTTCTQIDLEKLFTNGFSTGHGFLREPNDIMSYAALAAIAIQSNQNDQHGGQSIPYFDRYLAPGIVKTFRKELLVRLQERENRGISKENLEFINTIDYEKQKEEYDSIIRPFLIEGIELEKLLEYAFKATKKKTYQAMEGFVHNLNTMHSRAGAQVPFSSINFGMDVSPEGRMVTEQYLLAHLAGLGNGETPIFPIAIFTVKDGVNYKQGDANYDLFKLAIKVSAKRMFPNFCFVDAPFNLQYYKPEDYRTVVATMGKCKCSPCKTNMNPLFEGCAI